MIDKLNELDKLELYLMHRSRILHERYQEICREYSTCKELLDYVRRINVKEEVKEENDID